MNGSYRLGILVVLATLTAGALVSATLIGPRPSSVRAGHDLPDRPPLGAFELTERAGRAVTQNDLAGRVWIAAFVFTRCPASCPKISAEMKDLQAKLRHTGVRLVSLSVDPDHDTPEVLSAYAQRFGADPQRWWFLTGSKAELYDLVISRFHLGVVPSNPDAQAAGAEMISHSAKLALVDRGNRLVGYYDSDDPADLRLLEARARQLDLAWPPVLNATLNATSTLLLLLGWFSIRGGRLKRHAGAMIAAVVVSLLFLVSYLAYHYKVGSVPFRGTGPPRVFYFAILLSHTVLAIAAFLLVPVVLTRALKRKFIAHARLARVVFPIWLYVSITGVIVYLMLYQMSPAVSPG